MHAFSHGTISCNVTPNMTDRRRSTAGGVLLGRNSSMAQKVFLGVFSKVQLHEQ